MILQSDFPNLDSTGWYLSGMRVLPATDNGF